MTLERRYNPLNVDELGRNAARALICYPLSKLPPPDAFQGCGVYTIHYHGTFPAYTCMGSDEPIYVGKADPPGKRQGRIATAHNKTTLYGRLTHHARSIDSAGNLDLADFTCRWLVLDPVWISLTEQVLIAKYQPLWNVVVDGFGVNDPGKGRRNQKRSQWDTLHPGRPWAAELADNPSTPDTITATIRHHRPNGESQ
ncbi:MAG: Eco29kI family restriction endonuclease [Gammaproteobacteria bacterium]|nr:Eco29kI family restriction endonuclease [Gammaproteobacteria bacterium]MYG67020.1 Eco29kI family restriction endonuclease [Gammaproteobacteria bacterium]